MVFGMRREKTKIARIYALIRSGIAPRIQRRDLPNSRNSQFSTPTYYGGRGSWRNA